MKTLTTYLFRPVIIVAAAIAFKACVAPAPAGALVFPSTAAAIVAASNAQRAANERAAAARPSACYNVSDNDARTMCLARAHREPGQCYSIRRDDLRQQCLAEVQR